MEITCNLRKLAMGEQVVDTDISRYGNVVVHWKLYHARM